MMVESVALPLANRLAHDYQLRKADALQFFQYDPYDPGAFRERLEWLRSRPCPHRERLADGLHTYNRHVGNHPHALQQIEKLREPDTYVVIGGQQAGVMTGPLYTIHKAIHLIRAAKQLQDELRVHVVPVFWIAGEDHDIDEIDHLYLLMDGETKVVKRRLTLPKKGRASASRLQLDHAGCTRFIEEFFHSLTETEETGSIRDLLRQTAAESETVVEWFARLMARMFGHHGLVLVESSLPFVRELEKPVFSRLIERNEKISGLLQEARQKIVNSGYEPQLADEPQNANLFLYEGNDRLSVERNGERFYTRRSSYTRVELLALLERHPERFSANVVSRPLMQEHLFPTLAFIGGPGEVAYWAFFRNVFAEMGYQLPIVLPRLSITLVEGAIRRLMDQLELPVETVLTGFAAWKEAWQKRNEPDPLRERFDQTRQAMLELYRPLVHEVVRLDAGLRELSEKNVSRLLEQVDFLQERLKRSLIQREDVSVRRLMRVEAALLPEGAWQERKLGFFPFANKYGLSLLDRLVEAPYTWDGTHQVVYL